jgi:hypothetical protein
VEVGVGADGGVFGDLVESGDGGVSCFGEAGAGAAFGDTPVVGEVGLDVGIGEVVEEFAEGNAELVGEVGDGGVGGDRGPDDIGLGDGEGREVLECVDHGCRVEVRRGEARAKSCMLRKLRAGVTLWWKSAGGVRPTAIVWDVHSQS